MPELVRIAEEVEATKTPRELKRENKTVTVITGVPASQNEIAALAQQLKKLWGGGGRGKDGVIEIRGDHCDKVQAKVVEMGYKVKRAGG